jgi:hypothetical protein
MVLLPRTSARAGGEEEAVLRCATAAIAAVTLEKDAKMAAMTSIGSGLLALLAPTSGCPADVAENARGAQAKAVVSLHACRMQLRPA